ncbi:GTP-binding protein [Kamptonema sp. UHCC 0994]|uniref:GTP-binding protein n=1 Tax=Kamptonema sp. UHCC 0994 TaxID=3031329 RepID=UPI0023B9D8E9|nr:GTP-binding protein [Kamptonema sp. UHCC 0994]MDF0555691.1 GTP-binding protein [Kamptonema sp. UHCC 0994]
MEIDKELDNTILSFADIQSELNLRHAREALRDIVENMDLTPQERSGLEPAIGGLQKMLDKLERTCVQIAVFGMVGRGKSSVLNALLGQNIFETGPTHGVTRNMTIGEWDIGQEEIGSRGDEGKKLGVKGQLPVLANAPIVYRLSQVELIDTPGIDEVDGETREALARQVAKQADLILFVVAGDITKVEYEALSQLREAGKPMLLVFNKIDQYPDADRIAIYHKIRDDRVRELLSPDEIVMAAASPLIPNAVRRADGTMNVKMTRGAPQIDDLKLKILEILDREGKSLVALNTMLYAGDVNEQLVKRKMEIREDSANKIIWNGVMTKAVAIALNPITILDIISGAVIDVAMVLTLSKLYGIGMTEAGAVELLQKMAISMGGITASELVANFGLSSLKGLLGMAAPVTGGLSLAPYLSVAVTQAGVAGVSSYGIGQVTKAYLANGASWGDDGPKAVVSRILASLDEGSILNRIKDELRAKLNLGEVGRVRKERSEA